MARSPPAASIAGCGNSMVAVVTAEGPTVRTSHPPGSPLHGSDHAAHLSLTLPDCDCKPPARAVRARRCQRGSRHDHLHRDLLPGSWFEDKRTLRDEIAAVLTSQNVQPGRFSPSPWTTARVDQRRGSALPAGGAVATTPYGLRSRPPPAPPRGAQAVRSPPSECMRLT
jgi:hypothetical protein